MVYMYINMLYYIYIQNQFQAPLKSIQRQLRDEHKQRTRSWTNDRANDSRASNGY